MQEIALTRRGGNGGGATAATAYQRRRRLGRLSLARCLTIHGDLGRRDRLGDGFESFELVAGQQPLNAHLDAQFGPSSGVTKV